MIDLLLVNPSPNGVKLVDYLKQKSLSYKIVVTSGYMLGYVSTDENIINLNTSSVDQHLRFKAAVAWNHAGQKLIEFIKDQISIRNLDHLAVNRLQSYLSTDAFEENALIIETVSFKGQHVLTSAMINNNGQWKLFKEQQHPYFIDGVRSAFDFLDSQGITNGPAQVFITNNKHYLKMSPVESDYVQQSVSKHFVDIWPTVISNNDTDALVHFNNWADLHGPRNQYQLA